MAQAFIVLGSMKCGTTTLHQALAAHPEIELVAEKESSLFFDAENSQRAAARISASSVAAAGEVSTKYMQRPVYEPPVDHVARWAGEDTRLVAILRDPFNRAVSHWRHWYQLGWETRPLREALLSRVDNPYISFSCYYWQLEPWIENFDSSNILCMRIEDFSRAPSDILGGLWCFLGVADREPADYRIGIANQANERVVARGAAAKMAQSGLYRRAVRPLLSPEMRRGLARLMGGSRRRQPAPDIDSALRVEFLDFLHDDLARLNTQWSHLSW